jgi:hypothetical protein
MHMPIGIMVKAKNSEYAKGEIFSALDYIVGEGRPFDYYGDVSEVEKYSPEGGKGKELVDERLENNRIEFMDHIKVVREALKECTDKELYEKDFGNRMFRWHCYHAGEYSGNSCWLYDEWGSGLRNPQEFEDSLDTLEEGEKYYIVVVDVHC